MVSCAVSFMVVGIIAPHIRRCPTVHLRNALPLCSARYPAVERIRVAVCEGRFARHPRKLTFFMQRLPETFNDFIQAWTILSIGKDWMGFT